MELLIFLAIIATTGIAATLVVILWTLESVEKTLYIIAKQGKK